MGNNPGADQRGFVSEHYCDWGMAPDPEGYKNDPHGLLRCDKPAGLKYQDRWFCAEHYDVMMVCLESLSPPVYRNYAD